MGYGIAPEAIAGMLHKARAPFNLHVLAQEAALAALEDQEHVRRTVENNAAGMRFYEQAFRDMGLEWIPSQGNFILVKVGQGKKVFNDMLAKGVIVRAQDGYGLPGVDSHQHRHPRGKRPLRGSPEGSSLNNFTAEPVIPFMISPQQYIDGLEWRYACKKFDPRARIEEPVWHALAEGLRLSPSSLGLQLWKFVVVTNRELKERLREVSWNQSQVEDCSHYVVLWRPAGRHPEGCGPLPGPD